MGPGRVGGERSRESPQSLAVLVRSLAPRLLPLGAPITPAEVDDPHLAPLPPILDADWVARVGERDVLHVECQGYRDETFTDRVFRYHLHHALRYWGRRVFLMVPIHYHFEMKAWSETKIMVRFWIVTGLLCAAAFALYYRYFRGFR